VHNLTAAQASALLYVNDLLSGEPHLVLPTPRRDVLERLRSLGLITFCLRNYTASGRYSIGELGITEEGNRQARALTELAAYWSGSISGRGPRTVLGS
jgi:hypothetical protein